MIAKEKIVEKNILTFYEKIKIKNNIESLFNHYSGSYVFIEENPWQGEYIIRGKFHVKYGFFSKFSLKFDSVEGLREYSEFIESVAFLKNICEHNITPLLNDNNELIFLHNGEKIIQEEIESIMQNLKKDMSAELFNSKEDIRMLYKNIEDVDNKIKDKREQIKKMEIKIKEVREAAESFGASLKYITFIGKNSLVNRLKGMFKKEKPILQG